MRRTFLGLLVLSGCATSSGGGNSAAVTAEDAAQRQALVAKVQVQFPNSQYLVGFGTATTAQQAEDEARVRAAENISSEIHANLQSLQSQSSTNGKTTTGASVSEEIVQKVATDAGAFVHVRQELTTQIGAGFEAVAVVSRAEMDGKYARDSAPLLQKVLVAWDAALKQHGAIQAMASALCDARPYETKLDAIDRERWLVAGRGVWTDETKARRGQVEALRMQLRSIKVMVVRTTDVPGVDEAVSKAIAAAGFPVDVVGKPDCSAGGLVVAVAKQNSCAGSMLGPRCEITLAATANRCDDNDAMFVETSNKGVGMNASDEAAAARAAMKKVDVAKFADGVKTRVAQSVEGECAQ